MTRVAANDQTRANGAQDTRTASFACFPRTHTLVRLRCKRIARLSRHDRRHHTTRAKVPKITMASFNNSSFALLVFALVVAQMLAVAAAAPDGGVGHRKLLFGSDFDLQGLGQGLVNDLGSESIRCPLCSCAPEESPIAVRRVTFDCSSHSFLSSPAPFLTRPLANACVRYVCYRNKTHMQTWARRTPRSRPTSSVRSLDSRPAFGCLRRTSTTLARTRVHRRGVTLTLCMTRTPAWNRNK